mmetsp:Transcript_17015/g.25698  ORF Transcript_17015/g.25698 Transcript_17015/m.25698 type:complete len:290 (+) Transcript_17015:388-1257(+)
MDERGRGPRPSRLRFQESPGFLNDLLLLLQGDLLIRKLLSGRLDGLQPLLRTLSLLASPLEALRGSCLGLPGLTAPIRLCAGDGPESIGLGLGEALLHGIRCHCLRQILHVLVDALDSGLNDDVVKPSPGIGLLAESFAHSSAQVLLRLGLRDQLLQSLQARELHLLGGPSALFQELRRTLGHGQGTRVLLAGFAPGLDGRLLMPFEGGCLGLGGLGELLRLRLGVQRLLFLLGGQLLLGQGRGEGRLALFQLLLQGCDIDLRQAVAGGGFGILQRSLQERGDSAAQAG